MKYMAFIATLISCGHARADVTVFTNASQWQSAVGSYTTIDFTDYPEFTTITNQYEHLGILFTDGNDFIFETPSFPSDSYGLVSSDGFGNPGEIHMSFTQPQHYLGFDYIGHLQIRLYSGGRLVFESVLYNAGFFPFVGVVSTDAFDAAVARRPLHDIVAIDNLHFGPPIPGPGMLPLLAIAGIVAVQRKRRDHLVCG